PGGRSCGAALPASGEIDSTPGTSAASSSRTLRRAARPESGMSAKHSERLRVSQAEVDAFHADGAVVLRQLLEEHEVELLRAGIDENLAHPSPRGRLRTVPAVPASFSKASGCGRATSAIGSSFSARGFGRVEDGLCR